MGRPARPDLDRPGDARHHPDRLHPPGGQGRRAAAQRRVRQDRERQGSVQGADEEVGDRVPAAGGNHGRSTMIGPFAGVLFDGFAYGMLLFILSVGLSVTLGMMNFINLAHCSFAMLGGYVTVTLMDRLRGPVFSTLPAAFLPPLGR